MARKLHIGGKVTSPDWEIYNILDLEGVDHQGNAKDLSRFENDTFESLYASHVLEHFDYQEELEETLAEWKRVLLPEEFSPQTIVSGARLRVCESSPEETDLKFDMLIFEMPPVL